MRISPAHIIMAFAILVITALAADAGQTDKPPIPYYDYGACPFECCTYKEWTATAKTILRKDHNDSSPVIGIIKAGEMVQGLTGVVITTKPGKVKIIKEITLDEEKKISLKPGDIIYYLHYVGEGFDMFWFRGKTFVDQTSIKTERKTEYWETISLPEWVWWAKIKMSNGKVGWTRELKNFDHIDACE
jgi:hypothetical protein